MALADDDLVDAARCGWFDRKRRQGGRRARGWRGAIGGISYRRGAKIMRRGLLIHAPAATARCHAPAESLAVGLDCGDLRFGRARDYRGDDATLNDAPVAELVGLAGLRD